MSMSSRRRRIARTFWPGMGRSDKSISTFGQRRGLARDGLFGGAASPFPPPEDYYFGLVSPFASSQCLLLNVARLAAESMVQAGLHGLRLPRLADSPGSPLWSLDGEEAHCQRADRRQRIKEGSWAGLYGSSAPIPDCCE